MTDIKEKTKLKDKLAKKKLEDELDQPIESDKWINIWFMKDGHSFRGSKIHPSEIAAKISADESIASWIPGNPMEGSPKHTDDDYSHTIQIPLK